MKVNYILEIFPTYAWSKSPPHKELHQTQRFNIIYVNQCMEYCWKVKKKKKNQKHNNNNNNKTPLFPKQGSLPTCYQYRASLKPARKVQEFHNKWGTLLMEASSRGPTPIPGSVHAVLSKIGRCFQPLETSAQRTLLSSMLEIGTQICSGAQEATPVCIYPCLDKCSALNTQQSWTPKDFRESHSSSLSCAGSVPNSTSCCLCGSLSPKKACLNTS